MYLYTVNWNIESFLMCDHSDSIDSLNARVYVCVALVVFNHNLVSLIKHVLGMTDVEDYKTEILNSNMEKG